MSFEKIQKNFQSILSNILRDFDFKALAIIGPNGCGKSTFIKKWMDLKLKENTSFAYLPQKFSPYNPYMKVNEFIFDIEKIKKINVTENVKSELSQQFKINSLLEQTLMSLSGGETQRLLAFLCFYQNSQVVYLDEWEANLDPKQKKVLLGIFEKALSEDKEKKIIFVTHDNEIIEKLAESVLAIDDGEKYFLGSVKDYREKNIYEKVYSLQ